MAFYGKNCHAGGRRPRARRWTCGVWRSPAERRRGAHPSGVICREGVQAQPCARPQTHEAAFRLGCCCPVPWRCDGRLGRAESSQAGGRHSTCPGGRRAPCPLDDPPTPAEKRPVPTHSRLHGFLLRLAKITPVTGGHGQRRRPHSDIQASAEDQTRRGRARQHDRSGTLLWTGAFDSFGSAASNERALGGVDSGGNYFGNPTSGAIAGWIAAAFRNCSGVALSGFAVSFDGKQWRDGGGTGLAPTMMFEYGFGATFGRVASWVLPGALFDFTSPI